MTKELNQGKSEPLASRALRTIARRYKIKKPILVDQVEDQLRLTNKRIYQFRAVAEKDANGPQYGVVLDEEGEEIDLEEAQERDKTTYFGPADVSVDTTKLSPLTPAALVTIQPATNDLVLEQGDTLTETMTVTVPANATVPKVDVYFVADTTRSMGSFINAVKAGAGSILMALNGLGPDFAFGVGNYKDFPDGPYAFQHQLSPSKVVADVQNAISNWSASGGNDMPEGQLYALDKLAVPVGGTIGWRQAAKRIIVWFGDAPGHDPVCSAISGEPATITEALVTAKLVNENIAVLAISTATPGLDGDPKAGIDYVPACGAAGGTPGQGTNIANATGGKYVAGINSTNIVQTIIDLVKAAVGTVNNVKLLPSGATVPFVTSITPPGGYGPLPGDKEHVLTFEVTFTGIAPCKDKEQVFAGTIDVVADGAVVAHKRVRITVPACQQAYSYSVKFLCGVAQEHGCEPMTVQPGEYATEISIHNLQNIAVTIRKRFVPMILAGASVGREPRAAGAKAKDTIKLPPRTATMDDCCRIAEMLFGGVPTSPLPLTVGFLEVVSPVELGVTAVYTVSDAQSGRVSIDVEQVKGRKIRQRKAPVRGILSSDNE
jgi:hypothetical protein